MPKERTAPRPLRPIGAALAKEVQNRPDLARRLPLVRHKVVHPHEAGHGRVGARQQVLRRQPCRAQDGAHVAVFFLVAAAAAGFVLTQSIFLHTFSLFLPLHPPFTHRRSIFKDRRFISNGAPQDASTHEPQGAPQDSSTHEPKDQPQGAPQDASTHEPQDKAQEGASAATAIHIACDM